MCFSPRISWKISSNYVAFKFKGKLAPRDSVFSRVGVGMEGPNELSDVSPKFGLERR